jgi:cell division protein FtsB
MSIAEVARLSELKERVNQLEANVRALEMLVKQLLEAKAFTSTTPARSTLHLSKNG